MKKAFIVPIINQKGWIGKTTLCRNLAYCLNAKGYKVLIIDMDAQRNTDRAMNSLPDKENPYPITMFNVLNGTSPIEEAIHKTEDGIDLVRADVRMYSYRSTLIIVEEATKMGDNLEAIGQLVFDRLHSKNGMKSKEMIFQREVDRISNCYDYILIDTNPVLGDLLTISIMASNIVYPIIPLFLEMTSYDSILSLNTTISSITQNDFNRQIIISGFLVTRFEDTNIERALEEKFAKLATLMGTSLYDTKIPRAGVLVRESFLYGKSVIERNENARISKAYTKFGEEFIDRMSKVVNT